MGVKPLLHSLQGSASPRKGYNVPIANLTNPPTVAERGMMLESKQVDFLFADARTLYNDALEMLDQGRLRNAAEKAWCATKLATDAPIPARTGTEPRTSGRTARMLTSTA